MRKFFLPVMFAATTLFVGCKDDDSSDVKDEVITSVIWEPATVEIDNLPTGIPGLPDLTPYKSNPYPHTKGCSQDYLELKSDNTNNFVTYSGADCIEEITENAFIQDGTSVTFQLGENTINGQLQYTSTELKIVSSISEYEELITEMYPEASAFIGFLGSVDVILTFNKK